MFTYSHSTIIIQEKGADDPGEEGKKYDVWRSLYWPGSESEKHSGLRQ